jgi:hypothetical protein
VNDEPTQFLINLTNTLANVPLNDALSGMISATMLLIVGTNLPESDQDAILEQVVATMRVRLKDARSVVLTGFLPQ